MKRILVCGGRDYTNRKKVFHVLDTVRNVFGDILIIQGEARGADKLAKAWAISRGVAHMDFPADWAGLGFRAGIVRNQQMLDEGKPDLVIAFPGGSGTRDMVRRAKASGIEVEIIKDKEYERH